MQDLFSVPHITEEDVLAFVGSNLTAYSVEQKHGKMPKLCIKVLHMWNHMKPLNASAYRNCTFIYKLLCTGVDTLMVRY